MRVLTVPQCLETLEDFGVDEGTPLHDFFRLEVVGHGGKTSQAAFYHTAMHVRSRLYTVLSDPVIDRLFCAGAPTLNISELLNKGSMLFIATRKADLSEDGARLIGNFFMAVTHRTCQERVRQKERHRKPTYFFYDEFQNALTGDGSNGYNRLLCSMLDENRKFKLSVHLATTRFGVLSRAMANAMLSCCEIKVVGKMGSMDAGIVAMDIFGRDSEAVEKLTDMQNYHFWCRIRALGKAPAVIRSKPDPWKALSAAPDEAAIVHFRRRMLVKYGQYELDRRSLAEGETQATPSPTSKETLEDIGAL
jgi:hypothetical protein